MRDTDLLQLALGLVPPWLVARSRFDAGAQRLDIDIDFAKRGRFVCTNCRAADCSAYDTEAMTWRHLNFFQHEADLRARAARALQGLWHPTDHPALGAPRQRTLSTQ